SVNDGAPMDVPVAAGNPQVPVPSAVVVPLQAGANTITLSSNADRGPGIDRIAVAPLPPPTYVPTTTLTVLPHGVQWVGPGQQSVTVSATLRLDVDDAIDRVGLVPTVPAGWTMTGDAVSASTMRLGQTVSGTWTPTAPP